MNSRSITNEKLLSIFLGIFIIWFSAFFALSNVKSQFVLRYDRQISAKQEFSIISVDRNIINVSM